MTRDDLEWDILASGETSNPVCYDGTCVAEVALDDSIYGMNETSAMITGVMALEHEDHDYHLRRLTVRSEMDFYTEIALDAATSNGTEGILDYSNNNGGDVENPSSSGSGSRVMGWLFPVLAVIVVAIILIVVAMRKRNDHVAISAESM